MILRCLVNGLLLPWSLFFFYRFKIFSRFRYFKSFALIGWRSFFHRLKTLLALVHVGVIEILLLSRRGNYLLEKSLILSFSIFKVVFHFFVKKFQLLNLILVSFDTHHKIFFFLIFLQKIPLRGDQTFINTINLHIEVWYYPL